MLGDRRLSQKWGGSVLDSVVGTFCTQNVTDALSSKAFMNLAARFPSASSKQAALVASVQEPTAEQTCGDQSAGERASATLVQRQLMWHACQQLLPSLALSALGTVTC